MPVKGDDTCLIFDEDVFDDLDFKLDENTSHHVQKFCGVSTIVLWFLYVNLILQHYLQPYSTFSTSKNKRNERHCITQKICSRITGFTFLPIQKNIEYSITFTHSCCSQTL